MNAPGGRNLRSEWYQVVKKDAPLGTRPFFLHSQAGEVTVWRPPEGVRGRRELDEATFDAAAPLFDAHSRWEAQLLYDPQQAPAVWTFEPTAYPTAFRGEQAPMAQAVPHLHHHILYVRHDADSANEYSLTAGRPENDAVHAASWIAVDAGHTPVARYRTTPSAPSTSTNFGRSRRASRTSA